MVELYRNILAHGCACIYIFIYLSLVIAKTALDLSRMISSADRAALTAQGHAYRLGNVTVHVQHSTVHTSWWSHRDKKRKTGKHLGRGGGLGDRSGKFSLVSGGDDDLCNDKGLNNRQGQVYKEIWLAWLCKYRGYKYRKPI